MALEQVFELDRRIRYCAVLDEMGKESLGGMRPGVGSLEPEGEAEKVNLQVALTRGMAESTLPYFGRTDYIVIHREKLLLVALPRSDRRTVLVAAEPDFPLARVEELCRVVDQAYSTS